MRAKVFTSWQITIQHSLPGRILCHRTLQRYVSKIARSLLSLQVVASRQTHLCIKNSRENWSPVPSQEPLTRATVGIVTSPRPSLCDISPIGHEPTSLSCPPSTSDGTVSNVFDHLFCAGVNRQQHSMVQPRLRYHHSSAMLERILHWVPGIHRHWANQDPETRQH